MSKTDRITTRDSDQEEIRIGWREWAVLPDLDIPAIKVKVDTGARTSALHAYRMENFTRDGQGYVRFWLHPLRRRPDIECLCEAPVLDQRVVRDSGGHAEERYVIRTTFRIGTYEWPIDLTLTSREDMLFRMLLGRGAMVDGACIVDPGNSYLIGKRPRRAYPARRKTGETAT